MSEPTNFQADQDPAELLTRVRDLAPMIAANAEIAEQQRKPVDAVIEALNSAGSGSRGVVASGGSVFVRMGNPRRGLPC